MTFSAVKPIIKEKNEDTDQLLSVLNIYTDEFNNFIKLKIDK